MLMEKTKLLRLILRLVVILKNGLLVLNRRNGLLADLDGGLVFDLTSMIPSIL